MVKFIEKTAGEVLDRIMGGDTLAALAPELHTSVSTLSRLLERAVDAEGLSSVAELLIVHATRKRQAQPELSIAARAKWLSMLETLEVHDRKQIQIVMRLLTSPQHCNMTIEALGQRPETLSSRRISSLMMTVFKRLELQREGLFVSPRLALAGWYVLAGFNELRYA